MTAARGFLIVIAAGLVAALCGGALGYALGVWTPDYYRMVFRVPPGMPLDPVQVGMGLGVTQGLAAGLVVGCVVVASVAWHAARPAAARNERAG